ncbi:MAG: hypothetical protein ABIH59_01245 [archaeon]
MKKKKQNNIIKRSKLGQEEMVGFGLIIALVAVILLVFLWFSLAKPGKQSVESYEVESFVHSTLQYTTDCKDRYGVINIKDLIFNCYDEEKCAEEKDSCEVLNNTLKAIIQESWQIGENRPVKGFFMNVSVEGKDIFVFEKGNLTRDSKGYLEEFSQKRKDLIIMFSAHY